jgi:hypothetical protein
MNDTKLEGFMYSYIGNDGEERMLASSFGASHTKVKRYFNAQNNLQRLQPVKPHKLYEVSIVVGAEAKLKEKNT